MMDLRKVLTCFALLCSPGVTFADEIKTIEIELRSEHVVLLQEDGVYLISCKSDIAIEVQDIVMLNWGAPYVARCVLRENDLWWIDIRSLIVSGDVTVQN